MQVKPLKTRVFREGEDLISFILKYVKKLPERSVLVITSKIVALSEKRTVEIDPKISHDKLREKIIRAESEFAIKTEMAWLTIKDGMIMASAGIDESNAAGKLILLPKNSFKTAAHVRKILLKKYKIKNLGIIITDSRTFPLRAGVVGVALGYAGLEAIRDYRGKKDIFGRVLKMSRTDAGDSLATAAVFCMGEGREQQPLAIIRNAPVKFVEKINKKELLIDIKDDLYLPMFKRILKK